MTLPIDEEAQSAHLAPNERRFLGAWFTPAPLVERVLDAVAPLVPPGRPLVIVDPACGAGAFLSAAAARWPRASLLGAEVDATSAEKCRARVRGATVLHADALAGDELDEALARLPRDAFTLWVGNPPYNGTSALLRAKDAWARALAWFPSHLELPRGTSLREDFVFFLLRASVALAARPGALAFITSSTLLDAYQYAPVREALLSRLALEEVIDLGAGAFQGTRVATCVTVWRAGAPPREKLTTTGAGCAASRESSAARARVDRLAEARARAGEHREPHDATGAEQQLKESVGDAAGIDGQPAPALTPQLETNGAAGAEQQLGESAGLDGTAISFWTRDGRREQLTPRGPVWRLRPSSTRAEELDARWRDDGEALTTLVPVSFPGLKTRFDELLVDDDAERLLARVREFLATPAAQLERFAEAHSIPARLFAKLRELKAASAGVAVDRAHIRRFHRYRGPLAMGAPAWCYLDRRLIPRGDHRFRGAYDPHAEPVKLVFNVHELPLASRVVDEPGCVTAYRHSRFAPLLVPRALVLNPDARNPDGAELVPNLSPRGLALAQELGSPRAVFERVATFIMSDEFQAHWAPHFGTTHAPVIPLGE